MLTNGKKSCTPRMKHIKAAFFLAEDYHDNNKIEFAKCHTEKMWVGMLTKPKQGTQFRRDQSMLMNGETNYDDELERKNTDPHLLPKSGQRETICPNHSTKSDDRTIQDGQSPQECVGNHQT